MRHNPGTGHQPWRCCRGTLVSGPCVGRGELGRGQLSCSCPHPPAGPFPVVLTRGRLMSAPRGALLSVAGTEAQHTPRLPRAEGTAQLRAVS